jgi:hypothetical protein
MELARRNRLVAPGESARSRKIAPFGPSPVVGHAEWSVAKRRVPLRGATFLRTAWKRYRNRAVPKASPWRHWTVLSKGNNVGYGVTILDQFGGAIEQRWRHGDAQRQRCF